MNRRVPGLFLVLCLTLLTLSLPSRTLATTEGRTPGSFTASSTGAASYTIPIWTPPGPRGIQPNIALVYNSQSGNGPAGVGWSVAGLGSVYRCNLTYAQDAAPAPVSLVTGDGYCINGNRLRLTGGTYGTSGSTYQTEIADFTNITMEGTAGNGPSYFTVQMGNGITYYYGYTDSNGNGSNSQVLANGTSTANYWYLSKVTDPNGNNWVVNYELLTGTAVPTSILWTPTSSSQYLYTMTFNYTGNNASTSIYKYAAGTSVTNTTLLSSISISVSGTIVKDYFLAYTTSPTTGRNELQTLTECADSGESNCLLPTNVTYQSGSAGVATSATTAVSSTTNIIGTGDFNGDGYPDLVYASSGTVYVAFGSASGYGSGVSTGITTGNAGPIGDLLASGKDGILGKSGSTWYYYTWNGSAFASVSTGATGTTGTYIQTFLLDTNGDGLPDLVVGTIATTSTLTIQLNTSSGGTPSFGSTVYNAYSTSCSGITCSFVAPNPAYYGPLRSWDFNGDGRQDLLLIEYQSALGNDIWSVRALLGGGTTFTSTSLLAAGSTTTLITPFVLNWNDDGCTDIAVNKTLFLEGCNGAIESTITLPAPVLAALDWNGDGRTDLIVANGSDLGVYLSTATGLSSLVSTSVPYSSSCHYFTFDANGDGLDDLGCWSQSGAEPVSYYLHSGAGTPPDLATSFTDGYGNSASPTYVSLVGAPTIYEEYTDAVYPDKDYIGPLYVTKEAIFSDPSKAPGTTYNQTYSYYGAWTNLQGRGFDGFYAKGTTDSRNVLTDNLFYKRPFLFSGLLYQENFQSGSTPLRSIYNTLAYTTLSSASYQERYFLYASNSTRVDYEVGGPKNGDEITLTSTNYSYDSSGNATNIARTVTDEDSTSPVSPYNGETWTTTTTNTPDVDPTTWCLHLFTETQVTYTASIGGSVTRTKTATPDLTNCRYNSIITEPTSNSSNYEVTESFLYDTFGNVKSDTVLGNNMPNSPASRVTLVNWGTTGQFANTVTDPSLAVTTWTYATNQSLAFGVPDSVKDVNNLTTSWTYDAFGRKNKETRPDGTDTTWTWSACTSYCGWSNSVYQVAQTLYQTNGSTVIRTDTTSYDPVDRVTQTLGPSVTSTNVIVQKLYNSLGLLTQQSFPYLSGATAYQMTYSYDLINRLTTTSRPISSTNSTLQSTSTAYEGRTTTVTDPLSNTKTMVNDVNGWLRNITDAVGYKIGRSFDAAGSLTGVTDSAGNTLLWNVTYAYGLKPFLLSSSDADRGAWTYTVDSLGERIGWTDAKSQSFWMTYDALSRRLTRTEPDLFTQWTWGSTPSSYNVGRLISACTGTGTACTSSQYGENRTYDSYGRLSTRAIAANGLPGNDPGGVDLFTFGYGATTGLLSTLTYPKSTSGVALGLQYGYAYGLLQSVTDTTDSTATCGTTCTLWTANAVNGFGEVTEETLGNNVVTNRNYDAVTSWLTGATAGVGGGSGVVNQSYLQDKDGDVIQRQNNNLGLSESFNYDADNRVTCVALASTCSGSTVVYDGGSAGPGNITSMSGVGTYTYPSPGSWRPHAVTSITGTVNGITNPTYSYDANGNMTARESSTANITWSSYNYPTQISGTDATGTETVSFAYGPDRKRWEQIYNGTGYSTETTYYVGGLTDVMQSGGVTNYRHYIYAGREPVAIYSRTTSGGVTMSYFLEDHQQGISSITSNAGAVDVNESFASFGNRRNPTTWSGAPTTSDLNTIASLSRQGYTFQTALGQTLGLNHLNGRVQDAATGRMLSADLYVPDPTSSQSYNRYSYVMNNPLSFLDPSGFGQVCITVDLGLPADVENALPGGPDGDGADDGALPSVTIFPYTTCSDFPDPDIAPPDNTSGSAGVSPGGTPTPGAPAGGGSGAPSKTPEVEQPQGNPIKTWLCKVPPESSSAADTAANVGTAADNAKKLTALGGAAAGLSAANPYDLLTTEAATQAVAALEIFGRVGQVGAGFSVLGSALSGNFQGALYGTIDFAVYAGLASAGAITAAPTLGVGTGVSAMTALAYYTAGGSQALMQSTLCN